MIRLRFPSFQVQNGCQFQGGYLFLWPCQLVSPGFSTGTSGLFAQVTHQEPMERIAIFCGTCINQDGRRRETPTVEVDGTYL